MDSNIFSPLYKDNHLNSGNFPVQTIDMMMSYLHGSSS